MGLLGSAWQWIRDAALDLWAIARESAAGFSADLPRFVLIFIAFLVLGRVIGWLLRGTVWSARRVDPTVGRFFTSLVTGAIGIVGFTIALTAFGINVFGVALTIAAIGAALALGLQNTVANLMGGVSLALDRPFEVGDRIRLSAPDRPGGETWGDVEEIGLRSTKILTVRRELVTIPNRLLDQQEIWNYTGRYPELRVEALVPISYDSDWRLAERIMLEVGRGHREALPFPAPRVLLREFAGSAMMMELAIFIRDARRRRFVESDLRKAIKDRFDAGGIEIPYSYHTIVQKKDLPAPARAAPDSVKPTTALGPRRLLVATAGTVPAQSKAHTICDIAHRLHADMLVVYITHRRHIGTAREGEQAAAAFLDASRQYGVRVALRIEEGDVVDSIVRVVDEERCGGVVVGAPKPTVLTTWTSGRVEERLRERLEVPFIVVHPDLHIDEDQVEAVRAHLETISPLGPGAGTTGSG